MSSRWLVQRHPWMQPRAHLGSATRRRLEKGRAPVLVSFSSPPSPPPRHLPLTFNPRLLYPCRRSIFIVRNPCSSVVSLLASRMPSAAGGCPAVCQVEDAGVGQWRIANSTRCAPEIAAAPFLRRRCTPFRLLCGHRAPPSSLACASRLKTICLLLWLPGAGR